MTAWRWALGAGLLAGASVLLSACASAPAPRHTGMPGEALWLSRCDTCHDHPSPDRFDRRGWVATLERHHDRAQLTDPEWAQLLDFLAYRPGTSGGELASSGRGTPSP